MSAVNGVPVGSRSNTPDRTSSTAASPMRGGGGGGGLAPSTAAAAVEERSPDRKRKRHKSSSPPPQKETPESAETDAAAVNNSGDMGGQAGPAQPVIIDDSEKADAVDDDDAENDDEDDDGGGGLLRQASLGRAASEDLRDPSNYKTGDVVWVKMPNYQYWPSIVVKTTGKTGTKGKAKLFFNAINDGPEDKIYSIDLLKVGVAAKGKDPARDVQRFKGATMKHYYEKALSCHTLKDGGERDAALLETAFVRAKRVIQEKANYGSPAPPLPKKQKMYDSMSDDSDTEEDLESTDPASTAPEPASEEATLTEADKEILRLREPFDDGAACLDALRAAEGTIRGIVAGTHPSTLYARYKEEGRHFANSISTGPFKDEEEQVEPISDMLHEWFPDRDEDGSFKLVNEVLLEEALRLIVMHINGMDADSAKDFIERKQWMTSLERCALAKNSSSAAASDDDADAANGGESGNDSSDVE